MLINFDERACTIYPIACICLHVQCIIQSLTSPCSYDIMLSCWNESPRMRPTFMQLRATFDTLLLADRKGDYIEFSMDTNRMSALFEATSEPPNSTGPPTGGLTNSSPLSLKRHSGAVAEREECKLLLPSEGLPDDCQKSGPNPPGGTSPRLSPKRWSMRHSPQLSTSRHCSPSHRLSSSRPSPRKASDRFSLRSRSPLLFLGRRSPGSSSPQERSPFHASNPLALEERSEGVQQRPVSLLLGREREREREREKKEERYVREPTQLSSTNPGRNHSLTHLTTTSGSGHQQEHAHVRRGSEGMLNMNSDGYVSFVGMDYGRDRRAILPPSEIQITVTEDL